ncbi:hypothetical protein F1737_01000 [Methanoplanus sp. FWC-SCC4]|uniref:Uncharacterized protein n=1 Tax=Methanochimaera problematica TaxID=2609417 RepID=A0AA97FAJ9_9EURY|nr:hypothetical protein [Methanoplanus sp. FWC-SCC4]WOF15357.1 hypothetical protein F1737_01000 [Methanoplanus sp. FWC-SCC4]
MDSDLIGYLGLAIVTFCFGLLCGFQVAHIKYTKKLAKMVKRCIHSGTIAPVLVELKETDDL